MVRKKQLHVYLDVERYQAIERDAAKRGITIADYARHRLFEEPLPPERGDDDEETEDDAE